MRVIGTAGHVDHGKSTLVEALTGIDPDRLREEKERQMTIDLGFAWFDLPDGESLGIIDVPGHRDFIENMLAGVGGIDAALFVVAADEGVMPQSREHLAILDLLEVEHGVVALSKTDLVADSEWLALVRQEVAELLEGTHLAAAPIIPVSARTGSGLDELVRAMQRSVAGSMPRIDLGRPRLPVDRAFSIAGFGTVVTGTLRDGCLNIGDEVELLPSMLRGRVRGVQTHKLQLEQAKPGRRVAINLSGVEAQRIERGHVLALPGSYQITRLIDVAYRHLPDASQDLKHNQQVKLFHGSAQTLARVRLLGSKQLEPGNDGWLQLELNSPIVAVRADHYILRRPSPGATLGGGRIIDPHPVGKHKRWKPSVLQRFQALGEGGAEQVMQQTLIGRGALARRELMESAGIVDQEGETALQALLENGSIVALDPEASYLMARQDWELVVSDAKDLLRAFHTERRLRLGMDREEFKSRLSIDGKAFAHLLAAMGERGVLQIDGTVVALSEHRVQLSPEELKRVDQLLTKFGSRPHQPPSLKESAQEVGDELLRYLLESGALVRVAPDVAFAADAYRAMVERIRMELRQLGSITVAQVRDMFDTTRKYSLALMEHLDAEGITVREGDTRRLA